MPELPEVETTLRKIKPYLERKVIKELVIRRRDLRWPISHQLPGSIDNQVCQQVCRRGKYLLIAFAHGTVVVHLGMSGSLRWVGDQEALRRHDHAVFVWPKGRLVYHDPRRFGCILWHNSIAHNEHPLLKVMGIEPLDLSFNANWLYEQTRRSTSPVKTWIMNHKHVVGVGNIYANEALFHAGVSPFLQAKRLNTVQCEAIVSEIKRVLKKAIQSGGTTLRDYVSGENEVGHFQLKCAVYGRAGEACTVCGLALHAVPISSRQTVFCGHCQKVPKKYTIVS